MKKQSDQIRALIRSILLEDAAEPKKGPEFYTTARGEEFRVPTFSTKVVPRSTDDEEEEGDDTSQPSKDEPESLPPERPDSFSPIDPDGAATMSSASTAAQSAVAAAPSPAPASTRTPAIAAPATAPTTSPSLGSKDAVKPHVRAMTKLFGGRTQLPASVVISNPKAAGIKFTTEYDAPRPGRLHKGIDIVYEGGNILGADVYAIRAGQVIDFSNFPRDGRGKYVTIKHGNQGQSTYMHLNELDSNISTGGSVAAGQRIGAVGSTGSSTGNHLHLETKYGNGNYVDPLEYLKHANATLIFPVPAILPAP